MQRIRAGSDVIKVLFLIRSLEVGGAERQLVELVSALDKSVFDVTVATFYPGGGLEAKLAETSGVRLVSLEKRGRWSVFAFLWRLHRLIREVAPDIVHGYGAIANEIGTVAARMVGARSVWGLRHSNMVFPRQLWPLAVLFRLGGWFSRFPDLIIVNSWNGRDYHVAHGFRSRKMVVIPNGVDTAHYDFDGVGRDRVRAEWGVRPTEFLVGIVGRLNFMKDHTTFLQAASLVAQVRPDVRFVCVGETSLIAGPSLRVSPEDLGIADRLVWAGGRGDMPAVYSALDVLALSSISEGCPNVVLEAMACGRMCVVTDVGDARRIVGDLGIVVPPGRPDLLAEGLLQALAQGAGEGLAEGRRRRMVEEYGLDRLARVTAEHLKGLL